MGVDFATSFVRLWAMNWVEKEYQREMAIERDSGPLLNDLAAAIKDAVDTFNKRYRPNNPIEIRVSSNRVALSILLPPTQRHESEILKRADAEVSFDMNSCKVSAVFSESKAQGTSIRVGRREWGSLVL
jgi:hypothetical protein